MKDDVCGSGTNALWVNSSGAALELCLTVCAIALSSLIDVGGRNVQ